MPAQTAPASTVPPGSATRGSAPLTGALILLAAVQLMVVLDMTIVNVALPSIDRALRFNLGNISWIVNGYALPFGALLLFGGRSGDLLGRRSVFVVSVVAFAAASAFAGLSASPGMLIAARVAQGAAAAFAQATALSLIVSTFPAGPARNRAVGVFAAMEGLGAGLGLLLGGVIVQSISWRWVFLVNVPVGATIALLALRRIPASARERGHIDVVGAITATASLGALIFGLSRAAEHSWGNGLTAGPIAAGLLGLATFVAVERRSAHPLTPLWVFADRNRAGAYLIQALLGAALFGFFFLSTLFLQDVFGYKPLKAGAAFVPATVIMMVAAGLVPRVIGRIGVRPLIASGTAIAAVGMWLLGQLQPHSAYLTGVLIPMTVLTIGLGMVFVPATLSAVSGVDEEHSGLVSGVSTTAIQVGGAIGVAILATVAATTTRHATPGTPLREALTNGYTHAFLIGALVIALAVPIALVFLRFRPSTGQVSPEPAGADRITTQRGAKPTRSREPRPISPTPCDERSSNTGRRYSHASGENSGHTAGTLDRRANTRFGFGARSGPRCLRRSRS